MKSGANYLKLIRLEVENIDSVASIIFTFKGKKIVQKRYPEDVTYTDGLFAVPLKQEDTIDLLGYCQVEAQINYSGGSVAKSDITRFMMSETLSTEIVEGNTPSMTDKPIKIESVGEVLIAKIEGDISPEDIKNSVNEYLENNPIEAGISELECEQIVSDYVTENVKEYDDTEIRGLISSQSEEIAKLIPSFTDADNGKILGVVNGKLAWVVAEVSPSEPIEPPTDDEPEEPNPPIEDEPIESDTVPQSVTWQMKTTYPNGFVVIGKDDDTADQAMFVRMVNGYGFPVTINTTFSNAYDTISHKQTSDADSDVSLYPSGSVSRLTDGGTVHDVNAYIISENLGEVAQHGASTHSLWKSSDVTDEMLDTLYTTYTNGGGTRTKDDFFVELKRSNADSDVDQGASYVHDNRANLEADLNYPIHTLGTWGSSETFIVDGIDVCSRSYMSCGGSSNYAREWNYWGDGPVTAYSSARVRNPWKITRLSDGLSKNNVANYLDTIYRDNSCAELFCHKILTGNGTSEEWSNFKQVLDTIKSYVDEGKIKVVTRYQYSQLGEFVDNPITSVTVSRSGSMNVGDTDSESAYTVTVTYADGTSGQPNADMILDRSKVNTSESGSYDVIAYYRGFKATTNVLVMGAGITYPEGLKDTENWFVIQDNSKNKWYAGNCSKKISEIKLNSSKAPIAVIEESNSKISGWVSDDEGASWTQVTTDKTVYNTTCTFTKTGDSDGGYAFCNGAYNNKLVLIDSSGNFAWNY